MYTLKAKQSFDSAHFLGGYQGKCRNIHGHRWTVEIEIEGYALQPDGQLRGMVTDFGDLKGDLKLLTDFMDHAFIYEAGTLKDITVAVLKDEGFRMIRTDFRPTAENFARYFYEQMTAKGYKVTRSVVYETPDNCASYSK